MQTRCCDSWTQLAELRGVTVEAEAVRSLLDVVSWFSRFLATQKRWRPDSPAVESRCC